MASATLARAPSFSDGATESSRSRKLMSAGTVGALARKRSFDPGDDMQERRGRYRERSDMPRWYGPIGGRPKYRPAGPVRPCLLYTSDAADEEDSVDLGGRRI